MKKNVRLTVMIATDNKVSWNLNLKSSDMHQWTDKGQQTHTHKSNKDKPKGEKENI